MANKMWSLEALARPTKTYHKTTYERIGEHHNFKADGKTVVITGGASGVGLAITRAFAREKVARIAIISRSVADNAPTLVELRSAFPATEFLAFSASIADTTRTDEILREIGTIDILVLNAAIAHGRKTTTELTMEEVQDAFKVNCIAAWSMSKTFLELPSHKGGRKTVINVSAAAVQHVMSGPYRAAYGASKAAGVQMMQALASQYKNDDVRVFSFHPGSFYTEGVAKNMPKDMVQWEDVSLPADYAIFLAGEDSRFLHGRFTWAHWDVDELEQLKDRISSDPEFLTVSLVQ